MGKNSYLLIIIYMIGISALVIGCLAYTQKPKLTDKVLNNDSQYQPWDYMPGRYGLGTADTNPTSRHYMCSKSGWACRPGHAADSCRDSNETCVPISSSANLSSGKICTKNSDCSNKACGHITGVDAKICCNTAPDWKDTLDKTYALQDKIVSKYGDYCGADMEWGDWDFLPNMYNYGGTNDNKKWCLMNKGAPCTQNCQCQYGWCNDGTCQEWPAIEPSFTSGDRDGAIYPLRAGQACPLETDPQCHNGKCAHYGSGDKYVCCPPAKDWSTSDTAYYTGNYCTFWDDWCKMNYGEPCKHNCQCPGGVNCESGICGGGLGKLLHCQLKENHDVASPTEVEECLKTDKKPT